MKDMTEGSEFDADVADLQRRLQEHAGRAVIPGDAWERLQARIAAPRKRSGAPPRWALATAVGAACVVAVAALATLVRDERPDGSETRTIPSSSSSTTEPDTASTSTTVPGDVSPPTSVPGTTIPTRPATAALQVAGDSPADEVDDRPAEGEPAPTNPGPPTMGTSTTTTTTSSTTPLPSVHRFTLRADIVPVRTTVWISSVDLCDPARPATADAWIQIHLDGQLSKGVNVTRSPRDEPGSWETTVAHLFDTPGTYTIGVSCGYWDGAALLPLTLLFDYEPMTVTVIEG